MAIDIIARGMSVKNKNDIDTLSSQQAEKASIEYVNSQLAEIANQVDGNTSSLAAIRAAGIASPAGTYADLAALIAANPDHSKIYITLDDGNWCYHNGTAFVAGGVYQAAALETDKTLTVSGMAADAKVTGDKVGELKSAFYNVCLHSESVDITNAKVISGLVNNSSLWSTTSGFKSYKLPVSGDMYEISVTANSNENSFVTFLKNDTLASGTTPPFCTGTTRNIVPAGATSEFVIPSDCNYIIITKATSSTDYTPSSVMFALYKHIPDVDNTLLVAGDAADAKAVGDALSILYEYSDIGMYGVYSAIINSSSKWSVATGNSCWIIQIPDTAIRVKMTANSDFHCVIAFLTTNNIVGGTKVDFATGTGRIFITEGTTQEIAIPSDARYLYIVRGWSGNDYTPSSALWYKRKEIDASVIPLGLHERPENENILNIIKRCRQMTDIKWTPAVDLPRYMLVQRGGSVIPDTANAQNYLGKFKAGVEYTGVPYGRVSNTVDEYGYSYGTVGHYISFETFVSSISNQKSRLCTENIGSVSGHRSVIYATVCSGLTCYALNVNEVPTARIGDISGLSLIGKLNDSGTLLNDNLIKIGDILNKPNYHTAIITDIIREYDGTIVMVELSEATSLGLADKNYDDGQIGGICRRKGWTREQLFDIGLWGDYSVYRYSGSVPYTPSPYVNVGDEFDGWRIEHFPIMPYEGQGFAYKTGYIPNNAVKLVITLDGYAYVRVFKDGTEISGSPFSVTKDENNEINPISVTEIGEGEYTAYLCNITDGNVVNMSYACKWNIES